MAEAEKRIALLIDADNAPAGKIDVILAEVARHGVANVRRAYGNWKSSNLKQWEAVLHEYAIRPIQQFAYSSGKNASDMAMVVDAMDLLYGGRLDGFALVSSDADFTPLVMRLLNDGVKVYGFGERKTPESFRQACTRFIYTENLTAPGPATEGAETAAPASPAAVRKPSEAAQLIAAAVRDMDEDGDGWVNIGGIGNRLRNAYPDFDQRTYGHVKLSDLIRATGRFDVEAGAGGAMRVRVKPR